MTDRATPFFAVGIPAYQAERTVAESIESVLAQTFADFELVVVDDGSTDKTYAVARRYADRDPRVRVLRIEHAGAGAAREAAFAGATSPYLCRLDADDAYLPDYLHVMRNAIGSRPGYQIYSCNGLSRYDDGHTEALHPGSRWSAETSVTFDELIDGNPIFSMAVIEREMYRNVGGTRTGVYVEDYDFWLRALLSGARHLYEPETLGVYRMHSGRSSERRARMFESRIEVLEELRTGGQLSPERDEHCAVAVAKLKKRLLEQRVMDGEVAGILRLFREARPAYRNMLKYRAALLAGALDERLLARIVAKGRPVGPARVR